MDTIPSKEYEKNELGCRGSKDMVERSLKKLCFSYPKIHYLERSI
jgi:hypothetical protein